MLKLSLEHDNALGDWWSDVHDEHGSDNFEDSVRALVAAEAVGRQWVPTAESWPPHEVREFLDALFGDNDRVFFESFLDGWTEETGGDETQQVTADAWQTLRDMGRRNGVVTLYNFFGGGT